MDGVGEVDDGRWNILLPDAGNEGFSISSESLECRNIAGLYA